MQNKDLFYLNLAKQISTASYCKRKKVGALLVKDNNIISFGYNGTITGFDNTCECNNVTKPEVLHAESNAITKCAKSSLSSAGATLYLTLSPCYECSKLIIQAGISEVKYIENYSDLSGIDLLKKAGVHVTQVIS
jgi:dCMP deaminase